MIGLFLGRAREIEMQWLQKPDWLQRGLARVEAHGKYGDFKLRGLDGERAWVKATSATTCGSSGSR